MSNFTFTPVTVTRGRKFRGRAYSLGDVRPGMWGDVELQALGAN